MRRFDTVVKVEEAGRNFIYKVRAQLEMRNKRI